MLHGPTTTARGASVSALQLATSLEGAKKWPAMRWTALEYFDHCAGRARVDLRARMSARHRAVVTADFDVIVGADTRRDRLVHFVKSASAAAAQLHEGPIRVVQQRARLSSLILKKRWCRSSAGTLCVTTSTPFRSLALRPAARPRRSALPGRGK